MRYRWPADTVFTQQVLTVEQEDCSLCQRPLNICDHRFHRIFTLQGPLEIVCKLAHCPDPRCPAHTHTLSPLAETQITLPWWLIGWDVFCWMGHRRFAHHWSVPQLQAELRDSLHIPLSDDAISASLRRYQTMVAARHQDTAVLAAAYAKRDSLILTIDGLQPEKGHETLYVVRELGAKRIWFAQALLSSAAEEVRELVAKAKSWAEQLGKPVQLWMSDKQDAFVKAIATEFPKVPHRYCQNHFLRDVAKPMLEQDSHAKVKMRNKVRGLRAIERDVLAERRTPEPRARHQRHPQRRRSRAEPKRTPQRCRHCRTTSGMWCWTTAPVCVASSTMGRADRCTRLDCVWPVRWVKYASRSRRTWTRKKGARGGATEAAGGVHRSRPGGGCR